MLRGQGRWAGAAIGLLCSAVIVFAVKAQGVAASPLEAAHFECQNGKPECPAKLEAFKLALETYRRAKEDYLAALEQAFNGFTQTPGSVVALERARAGLARIRKLQDDYAAGAISDNTSKLHNYVSRMDGAKNARAAYAKALAEAVEGRPDKAVAAIRAAQETFLRALEGTVDAALLLTADNRSVAGLPGAVQELLTEIQRLVPIVDGQVRELAPYADQIVRSPFSDKRAALDKAKHDLAVATTEAEQAGVVFKTAAPEPEPPANAVVQVVSARYGKVGMRQQDMCDVSEQFRMACHFHAVKRQVCFKNGIPGTDCGNGATGMVEVTEFVPVGLMACGVTVGPDLCDVPAVREQFPRRATVQYRCSDAPATIKTANARDEERILLTCAR